MLYDSYGRFDLLKVYLFSWGKLVTVIEPKVTDSSEICFRLLSMSWISGRCISMTLTSFFRSRRNSTGISGRLSVNYGDISAVMKFWHQHDLMTSGSGSIPLKD